MKWLERVAPQRASSRRGIAPHIDKQGKPCARAAHAAHFGLGAALGPLLPYAVSLAVVAAMTGLGLSLRGAVEPAVIAMIYLTATLVVSLLFNATASLLASLLSAAAFDFFFTPPFGSFSIDDPRDVAAFICFLAAALATSGMATRARAQTLLARRQAAVAAELNAFSGKLIGLGELEPLLATAAAHIGAILGEDLVILLGQSGTLSLQAACPAGLDLDAAALASARRAWLENREDRIETPDGAGRSWLFLPVRTAAGTSGVFGVARAYLPQDEEALLQSLIHQTTIAIDRIALAQKIEDARAQQMAERLRSALLSSISHDLRTPLASILGILTSLAEDGPAFGPEAQKDLVETAQEETERLNRFVNNLLDVTSLDSGAIELRREPAEIGEILACAVRRAQKILRDHRLVTRVSPNLPILALDVVLLEQALFNLLDNAAKYAPAGTTIAIHAEVAAGAIVLRIADEGPGIPPGDLDRVFDKFFRVKSGDRRTAGTGLGLAIARGFVEIHGGRLTAANRNDPGTFEALEYRPHGAVFTLTLPLGETVSLQEYETGAVPSK